MLREVSMKNAAHGAIERTAFSAGGNPACAKSAF
jgi:hypothetical protein